ncbi:MAG: hypothetical protein JOZ39_05715 [Chloroflexi bacterium]|nr:hypothetical protein [Chloroflexota bacterium]
MNWLARFAAFWYDFIVGDDGWLAAGAVAAIAFGVLLTRLNLPGWLMLPAGIVALLCVSVLRARPSR